jgi:hypothetical protein
MNYRRIGVGVVALALSAHMLVAQQPGQARQGNQRGMRGDSAMAQQHMHMHMMDSLNAHLDTLVSRMNMANGNAKVMAMADVINALVAERGMMQKHMRQMMGNMKGKQPPRGNRRPAAKPDSSAADSGHAGHHPPK